MAETRMVVEVWSDIMCPFCFLGKRRFAAALEHFAQSQDVAVTWRSFQLNPTLRSDATMSVNEYLAREKGIYPAQAALMHDRLVRLGENAGIEYNFDRAVVANTFDAHRMIHLAARRGKEDAAVERLFTAYFTEGKNIADHTVLAELGRDVGLDAADVGATLASDRYSDDVRADITEAHELGIHGVPFFIFDGRYAVSGAHEVPVFAHALARSYAEWQSGVA